MSAGDPAGDPDAAAALLLDARRRGRAIGSLPEGLAPRDEAGGVAIQHALALRVGAGRPAGFKIGATGARMQAYLGITAPIGGFIGHSNLYAGGAALPFARFRNPGVECELAVRLSADLQPGPCDLARAAAAVAEVVCGIEIVENRYTDMLAVGVPTLAADQMFHAAAVLGEAGGAAWRGLDLVGIAGSIAIDGQVQGQGVGGDLLGHPLACLAWLAASPLAARFGGLKAGQVVMLGSVTPPIWLSGPARVRVAFPPLPSVELLLA